MTKPKPVPRRLLRKLRPNELQGDLGAHELLFGPTRRLSAADFREYQTWMYQKCYEEPFIYLGAEMGLGKTGAVLRAVRRLLDEQRVNRVLIIAPVKVAEDTWPEEIRTWDFARALDYSLLTGPEEERKAAARDGREVHIINRENLVWLFEFWRRDWPYDMVVYDEASRLKAGNRKSKPTQRADGTVSTPKTTEFGALARLRATHIKRLVAMSGTPAPGGLKNLWGQFYVLDLGERLGHKKTHFMNRWFRTDPYTYAVDPLPHAMGEIMGAVSDIMVSLREEDYLNLPPLMVDDHWVTLPPKVMEQYRRFEKTLYLKEYDLEAVNAGVLTNKLLQFANGSLYVDEGHAEHVHDLKLNALADIVEQADGQPMLIAYSFKFDVERIKKRFPKFRIFGETKNDTRDWNAGRLPAMIVHPASAGHGMNFQYGGNIAVWYGLNWSLELYLQFLKRLHRSGQKADHVMMHRILARNTEDVHVAANLIENNVTQRQITEYVRVRAEQLRKAA
jgi:hypothetical protein